MNLITDVEAAVAAFKAMIANPGVLTLLALIKAGGAVVDDITNILTPAQIQEAHNQAKQLRGQSASSLLSGLESQVSSAKGASTIPWTTILSYILALLQQLLTPATPAS